MKYITGVNRSQITLMPGCLDDYVGEDNAARVIDAFRPTDIPIVRHERLKLDMNPYSDKEYFLKKKEKRKTAKKKAYKETAAFKSNLTLMTELKVKNA